MNNELIEQVARAINDVQGGLNYDYFCRYAAKAAIAAMQPHIEAQREDAARRALEVAAAIVERRSTELMARAVDAPRTASAIRAIDPAQFREAGNG